MTLAKAHRDLRLSNKSLGAILAVITSLILIDSSTAYSAQDEHNRRFAVELAVVAGDMRLLQQDGLTDRHRRGLSDRIESALGFIGLTGRKALRISTRQDPNLRRDIARLRSRFTAGEFATSEQILQGLQQRYPLDTRGFLPIAATSARLKRGREIYRNTCRPCHIAPDTARPNPAHNLFRDAAEMPREEFVARLLGGVRGVPETGLENPLPDEDLRALLAWFMHGG